jgi:hypothetical protein
MPLSTRLGGSWLNMAESIQRILKRRTLDGQHPQNLAEIGTWFQQTAEAWNRHPTPALRATSAWSYRHEFRVTSALSAHLLSLVLLPSDFPC